MHWGLAHIVRWALYVDVGLIFGMPAVAWAAGGQDMLKRWRGLLLTAGLICAPLSLFGFLVNIAEMAAVSLGGLDRELIFALLTGSALGLAMIARCVAALVYSALLSRGLSRAAIIAAGVAVITLAWSGHGGASEGALGYVRIIGDMIHLLAASAWIGALALFFLALLEVRLWDADGIEQVGHLLARFALSGSIIVATLVLTGFSNMLFIASPSTWPAIARGPYGQAMLAKLALFLGMLVLATINRFVLTPRLFDRAVSSGRAVSSARVSVSIEAVLGIAILALVAWLGTLNPMAS